MELFADRLPPSNATSMAPLFELVAAGELEKALHEMELSMDIASATCSHCGAVDLRPGFSRLLVLTCDECGEVTKFSNDP
jgi:hypothetical protein